MKKLSDEAYKALCKYGYIKSHTFKWPEGMFLSHNDLRTVACGLLPDGVDVNKLTPEAREEIRAAIDVIIKR